MIRLALCLAVLGLTWPLATRAAGDPTLSFAAAPGYQMAFAGTGWPAGSLLTFTLEKGTIDQVIQLRADGSGAFTVGVNHANRCGLLAAEVTDLAGHDVIARQPAIMCTANASPPPAGTARIAVLKGRPVAPAATTPGLSPAALVSAYFSDLNAHRSRAAQRLQARCPARVTLRAGHRTMPRRLPGRKVAVPVAVARISAIHPIAGAALSRMHFLGFQLRGTFRFTVITNYRSAGQRTVHRIAAILRPCAGRLRVDPNWTSIPTSAWR